jgi:two-component system response regulator YesN
MLIDGEKAVVEGLKLVIATLLPECKVVGCAYDGDEGFRLGLELRPGIIITDIKMLKVDGLSMIERLQDEGLETQFVILSAYQDFKFTKEGMRLGVRHYLTKPVEEMELQECIRKIINSSIEGAVENEMDTTDAVMEEPNKRDIMLNIRQYLADNFGKNEGLRQLSERFNVSFFHLSHLFKEKIGLTCSEYIAHLRVQKAKELLAKTEMKVYEICMAVSLSDPVYFSKTFESIAGCTPRDYRKRIQDN